MQLYLHQTRCVIGGFDDIFFAIKNVLTEGGDGVHLFPEYFLTGHPLFDLCLQKAFMERYREHLLRISNFSLGLQSRPQALFLGGLSYHENKISNVVYHLVPSCGLEAVYTKILLPNYDIFDEKKYFSKGKGAQIIPILGKNIGILICEDMWYSCVHSNSPDPVKLLQQKAEEEGLPLDMAINFSASPYHVGKRRQRIERGKQISQLLGAPFIYINKVGGEDGLLFDGSSFMVDEDNVLTQLSPFKEERFCLPFPTKRERFQGPCLSKKIEDYRNSLFSPHLNVKTSPPTIRPLTKEDCEEIVEAIIFGIREYRDKTSLYNLLVGVSGGIDSALVLTLAKLSLEKSEQIEALYMPSEFSSIQSTNLSLELCKNLQVKLLQFPIASLHSVMREDSVQYFSRPLKGVVDENIQCRLRASILYTRSNQNKAMILNTSNKSELAVGYSTLYGDSVGAISPLGDLYKSEVYLLANYINEKYGELIPWGVLERPPSAELRHGQVDEDSLPPYERLDAILEGILSYRLYQKDFKDMGFDSNEVQQVFDLYRLSEYKRFQFCPIIKVKPKSFGPGHRMPICRAPL